MGYLRIAEFGYHEACALAGNITPLRLFPLYPMLVKVLSFVLFRNYPAAAILASSICALAASVFLWKLTSMDENEETAYRTLLFMLIFPGSFFLVACYAESLFLLTLLAATYQARRGKWFWAGLFGMLCSLAHPTGVLVALFLTFEYMKQKEFSFKRVGLNVCSLVMAPLGVFFYMAYLYSAHGSPFLFITAQKIAIQREFSVFIYRPVWRAIRVIANNAAANPVAAVTAINLALLSFFIFLTVMAAHRMRSTYTFFMAAFLAALLMTDSRSFPLVSMSRLLLPLFPAFILTARADKHFIVESLYVTSSTLLLGVLGAVFSSGVFFVA